MIFKTCENCPKRNKCTTICYSIEKQLNSPVKGRSNREIYVQPLIETIDNEHHFPKTTKKFLKGVKHYREKLSEEEVKKRRVYRQSVYQRRKYSINPDFRAKKLAENKQWRRKNKKHYNEYMTKYRKRLKRRI